MMLFLLGGCAKHDSMKQCEWILGQWQAKTDKGVFYENWIKQSSTNFTGQGGLIIEGDTAFRESLALESKNGGIFYIPTIATQNQGKPVEFMLMAMGKELVFENLAHDFPQRIVYHYHDDDHVSVTLTGKENGQPRKAELKFTKQQ